MYRFVVFIMSILTSCGDETISGYGGSGTVWALAELNGETFEADATLQFPEEGKIAGRAPCNSFQGSQLAPYPWFEVGPMAATRMACDALEAEGTYLAALGRMKFVEVAGDTLILSNDAGESMVFRGQP